MIRFCQFLMLPLAIAVSAVAHAEATPFSPLGSLVDPPSATRGADGRPTSTYWQQHIAYDIDATLDVERRVINAQAELRYTNNAPQALDAIWFEISPEATTKDAIAHRSATINVDSASVRDLRGLREQEERGGGLVVSSVADSEDRPLAFEARGTQLRVALPRPLASGQTVRIKLAWRVALVDLDRKGGRTGYMLLSSGDPIFHIAQWYPQPVAFTDYGGWRNVPFVDHGEFAPELGDYNVSLTLPAGQLVAATGVLTNEADVLTGVERTRLARLRQGKVTEIVTAAEAATKRRSSETRTWRFAARNVRDFALAASLRYRWDATLAGTSAVRAMTFYPSEASALWRPLALPAIGHALDVYGRMTFDYPYPVVQAAFGPNDGMEHTMLAFSRYPPDGPNGTYSRERKRDFLWVLTHEVGHNWFPLIVNSDERAWTWMDEGLTSYLETLATLEWSGDYTTRPNLPAMLGAEREATGRQPPMTPANAVVDLFPTQYHRPAAALQVLRELVLGRETFDRAFRAYARAWMFKRPTPGDFFRTINQESGADLDWFWRAWFFSTDHVDLSLERVAALRLVAVPADAIPAPADATPPANLTVLRNAAEGRRLMVEQVPRLADAYDRIPERTLAGATPSAHAVVDVQRTLDALGQGGVFYELDIRNRGGVVSPVPIRIDYRDGTSERYVVPVELWFGDTKRAQHILWRAKSIRSVTLDPDAATGDVDRGNNGGAVPVTEATMRVRVDGDSREFLSD